MQKSCCWTHDDDADAHEQRTAALCCSAEADETQGLTKHMQTSFCWTHSKDAGADEQGMAALCCNIQNNERPTLKDQLRVTG